MLLAPQALGQDHVLHAFNSGQPLLDDWLKRRAPSNHANGASRTFVLATEQLEVVGFYCLSAGGIAVGEAPGSISRNIPDPIPVALLGRLAIDLRYQGQGLGQALLRDTIAHVRMASEHIGIRGILVHAIDEAATRFYAHRGFIASRKSPMTLLLSVN